jgi:hypothetical protein
MFEGTRQRYAGRDSAHTAVQGGGQHVVPCLWGFARNNVDRWSHGSDRRPLLLPKRKNHGVSKSIRSLLDTQPVNETTYPRLPERSDQNRCAQGEGNQMESNGVKWLSDAPYSPQDFPSQSSLWDVLAPAPTYHRRQPGAMESGNHARNNTTIDKDYTE